MSLYCPWSVFSSHLLDDEDVSSAEVTLEPLPTFQLILTEELEARGLGYSPWRVLCMVSQPKQWVPQLSFGNCGHQDFLGRKNGIIIQSGVLGENPISVSWVADLDFQIFRVTKTVVTKERFAALLSTVVSGPDCVTSGKRPF